MPSAKNVETSTQHLKIMVVGSYGTGKSTFAASAPTPGFVFDFDGHILTYAGKDFDYETYKITWQDWVKFEKDLLQLRKDCKYKTVVVDSTTAMTDLAMERALMLDPKRSPTGGPIWNVHYQMVRNLVEGKLRQVVSLPANVIVLSHIDIKRDESTGAIIDIGPLLTGQLSEKVPGYFDEVYYATTRREKSVTQWYLQTVPIGLTKARSILSGKEHRLPDFVPNDWQAIMKYIEKGGQNGK